MAKKSRWRDNDKRRDNKKCGKFGGRADVICEGSLALEDEARVAVEGVLGGRLHRPLAVVLGDRRVRTVLLRLGPVSNSQHVIYEQNF